MGEARQPIRAQHTDRAVGDGDLCRIRDAWEWNRIAFNWQAEESISIITDELSMAGT